MEKHNVLSCNTHLWEALGVTDASDSTDEVHHNQMEDGVSEKEVGKSSFWGDGQEISFVLWVDLDAKTNCRGKEARETNVNECCQSSEWKRNGFSSSVSYPCEWLLMQTEMLVQYSGACLKIMKAPDNSCKHATRHGNNVDRVYITQWKKATPTIMTSTE